LPQRGQRTIAGVVSWSPVRVRIHLSVKLGLAMAAIGALLSGCATAPTPAPGPLSQFDHGTMKPYQVNGVTYQPREQPTYDEQGVASWYGAGYGGKHTANGEVFDEARLTGAHTTLPLPCIVEVTNMDNGRTVRLRVNDRGPFVPGRILDMSPQAARELNFYARGSAWVRVRYIGPAPAADAAVSLAKAQTAPTTGPSAAMSQAAPEGAALRAGTVRESQLPPPTAPATTPAPTNPNLPEFAMVVGDPVSPTGAAATPAATPAAASTGLQAQAGAFASRQNADRLAARFEGDGGAVVVPLERGGVTLWRVLVNGRPGESLANLKARAASAAR